MDASRARTRPGDTGPGAPERRCVLTGERAPRDRMIRFVQGPDGMMVPDLAETLPGRGVWISADRARLEDVLAKRQLARAFSRGLKRGIRDAQLPADLPDRLERLLLERVQRRLGLERRAGRLVIGFEAVKQVLESKPAAVLLEAADASWDGRRKLRALAEEAVVVVSLLTREEMSLALGRGNVVHAAVDTGGGAQRLLRDLDRLAAWRRRPLGNVSDGTARRDE